MASAVVAYVALGLAVGFLLSIPLDCLPAGKPLRLRPRVAPGRRTRTIILTLICGAVYGLLAWLHGLSAMLLIQSLYATVLLFLLVYDLENRIVPNVVVLPGAAVAVLLSAMQALIGFERFPRRHPLWPWLAAYAPRAAQLEMSLWTQLAGGLVAFGIFLGLWLISRQIVAEGDVKMALFCGLVAGYPGALLIVFGAFVLFAAVITPLLIARRITLKSTVAFAPFLSIATFLAML